MTFNKRPDIRLETHRWLLTIPPVLIFLFTGCHNPHKEMVKILADINKRNFSVKNPDSPEAQLLRCDSTIKKTSQRGDLNFLNYVKASLLVKTGQEKQASLIYEDLLDRMNPEVSKQMLPEAAIAYMRVGERSNCMINHSGGSCIFPIKDDGIHQLKTGSEKAITIYKQLLKANPDDLESRWLLNIAYMTLGQYPGNVPRSLLIPDLDLDTGIHVTPFTDIASELGLDVNNKAGGVITDDFNNDGYLDIFTSSMGTGDPMHYFQNNKDGSFSDLTKNTGLDGITGGLNIQQTDYNNDGYLDIFVLRGGWLTNGFGNEPASLLRNNGDGTFTDVTAASGLLSYQPTQTATWADFNSDGWLDVFVGAENSKNTEPGGVHPCKLFINNQDGTFTEQGKNSQSAITAYVKGVTSGDFDNDGRPDLYISSINGEKYLLKNITRQGREVKFEDVTANAGIRGNNNKTFGCWFFDYNNDGWPDLLTCSYDFRDISTSLGYFAAAEALGKPVSGAGNIILFQNNKNGTFTDVSKKAGLEKVVFAMGANFGDIDNDGFPDMYFGTGNPDFRSLVPNKLFKNIQGKKFADVTTSSRTGNLQKGHGVAFADFRNCGLQDVYIDMGGTAQGDAYPASLYLNPGFEHNNWISLKLEGVKANKAGIGSLIKLTFIENGIRRTVYKVVNSGGSFGSSPLRQEIGVGKATLISDIEIKWAGSPTIQHFKNIAANQFLHITEGNATAQPIHLSKLAYKRKPTAPLCFPVSAKVN
ncbi:CRTAC1 family protein [Pedobacter sp. HMF7647]|uniref:CRTAC1 family protein n=1 Tax=Hufsiella arboris TaxID=2695275 RepID=A0A7K1Y9A6_9SPHI|nr:CRTAC1 family protein [Hufsiella arboris]MXV51172.1 CRTAC1 family protein [Hufsiella arboris]